jgi:hypothetical protein
MHVFIDPTKAYRQRTKSVVDILSWGDTICIDRYEKDSSVLIQYHVI